MNGKVIFVPLALLAIMLIAGCSTQVQQPAQTPAQDLNAALVGKTIFTAITPGAGVSTTQTTVTVAKGTKLFNALLGSGIYMEYDSFAFGKMITAIGNAKPAQGEYIAIYVNSVYAEQGISDFVPASGDVIEFRVEKVQGAFG